MSKLSATSTSARNDVKFPKSAESHDLEHDLSRETRPNGSIGDTEPSLIVIEARPGWKPLEFAEYWRFRELLYFLIWRDVKVRYKQSVLGATWAVLQPLATMLVFTVFIGRLAITTSAAMPYYVYAFLGLVPWTFFANALTGCGASVVANQNLISKVYFPRIFIPIGTAGACLVDFAISAALFVPILVFERIVPSMSMIALPFVVLSLLVATIGVGTLLAALTVAYRDFRHVVPFMVQLWMFATPCIYLPPDVFAGSRWERWLPLNPAHGLILNFRYSLTGHDLDTYSLFLSASTALATLFCGAFYFNRVERTFADIV